MFKFYEVGGKVRDEFLGLTNKDIDYVAVPCEEALKENLTTCDMFQLLWEHLIAEKFEIFLVTPDCYTIRARFPAQAAMVVEECSELTNAICKFRRGRVGEDDIITEIADVMIMCEQLSNYFGKEKVELEKERKLERLKERLSKYTD